VRRKLAAVDSTIDGALIDAEKLRELLNVEQLGERVGRVIFVAVIHDEDFARGFPGCAASRSIGIGVQTNRRIAPRISPLGLVPV
jgi:hypothetical protein